MGPLNYDIDVKAPFEGALKGFAAGTEIAGVMQKQELQKIALMQQQQMQRDLATFSQLQNPGAKEYASLMTRYPSLAEHFKKGWDVLNADQQQNKLTQATQVYAAMQSGRGDVASGLLKQQAQAMRNAGNEQDARAAETMAQFIEMDPQSAKTTAGLVLSSIMGPEKFATTFQTLGTEQRSTDQAPADLKKKEADATKAAAEASVAPQKAQADLENVVSQTTERFGRLGLDRDKLATETKLKLAELNQKANTLDDGSRKLLNESAAAATGADAAAAQMLSLADRLEQAGGGYGAAGKAAEWLAGVTGKQDAMTGLRQEYVRLRNSAAIKSLPPGPATDKDIALALKGFPDETADAKFMASFMRGMAKIQQREAATESAKAEWVGAVGHLGKPKADIEIEGIKVPAGTSYVEFTRQYLDKRTAGRAQQQGAQQIQSRSYMRFAAQQPAPGTPGTLGSGTYGMGQ